MKFDDFNYQVYNPYIFIEDKGLKDKTVFITGGDVNGGMDAESDNKLSSPNRLKAGLDNVAPNLSQKILEQ